MNAIIKVGFLVSYDYKMLYDSLPLVYDFADRIVLAIDKQRLTWVGNKFEINSSFFKWVESIDIKNKISIFEDDFYIQGKTPMFCDTNERNMLAKYMGKDGWHIQIDADEYFIHFDKFTEILRKISPKKNSNVDIYCNWITLYKKLNNSFLYIDSGRENMESVAIATNNPEYISARRSMNKRISFDFPILHNTWARENKELYKKITNWSHTNDFDVENYFAKWKSINETNYSSQKNMHPITPNVWPTIGILKGGTIKDLILNEKKKPTIKFMSRNAKIKIFAYKLGLMRFIK